MTVKKESNKFARKFLLNYQQSKFTLKLLRLLGEGRTQGDVAKRLHSSKQRIYYWIHKALNQGLIRIYAEGIPRIYELTALGQKFLIGSERGFREPVSIEDYALKFPLIADRSNIKWELLGRPNNWKKMGFKLGSITVEKTTQNIIIHSGQLSGFYEDELYAQAGGIVEMVRAKLVDLGVETGDVGSRVRDGNVKMFTPEADKLHRDFGNVTTDDGQIDDSPPEDVPHEERSRPQQRDYLAMSRRIAEIAAAQPEQQKRMERIESSLVNIEKVQERLVNGIEKTNSILEKAFGKLAAEEVTAQKVRVSPSGRLYE